jgi:hypothetical protein
VRRYRALLALGDGRQLEKSAGLLAESEALFDTVTDIAEARLDANYLWLHTTKMNVFYLQGHLEQALAENEVAGRYFAKLNRDGAFRAHDYKIILGDLLFSASRAADAEKTWLEMLATPDGLPYQIEEADALVRLGWLHIYNEENEAAIDVLSFASRIFMQYGQVLKKDIADGLIFQIQSGSPPATFAEVFGNWP